MGSESEAIGKVNEKEEILCMWYNFSVEELLVLII